VDLPARCRLSPLISFPSLSFDYFPCLLPPSPEPLTRPVFSSAREDALLAKAGMSHLPFSIWKALQVSKGLFSFPKHFYKTSHNRSRRGRQDSVASPIRCSRLCNSPNTPSPLPFCGPPKWSFSKGDATAAFPKILAPSGRPESGTPTRCFFLPPKSYGAPRRNFASDLSWRRWLPVCKNSPSLTTCSPQSV